MISNHNHYRTDSTAAQSTQTARDSVAGDPRRQPLRQPDCDFAVLRCAAIFPLIRSLNFLLALVWPSPSSAAALNALYPDRARSAHDDAGKRAHLGANRCTDDDDRWETSRRSNSAFDDDAVRVGSNGGEAQKSFVLRASGARRRGPFDDADRDSEFFTGVHNSSMALIEDLSTTRSGARSNEPGRPPVRSRRRAALDDAIGRADD